MKVSKRRASFADRYCATSKFFTSPAICVGKPLASKRVMPVMPERPATIALHASLSPMPTGETMPKPVTTTLRLLTLHLKFVWDEVAGQADRLGTEGSRWSASSRVAPALRGARRVAAIRNDQALTCALT